MTPVAVTGLGVVSGFGLGVEPFWGGMLAGRSGLRPIERFAALGAPLVGAVDGLEVRAYAQTALARRIDRTSLLALAACRLAIADAGGLPASAPDQLGLVLGSALGNLGETTLFLDRLFARGAGNPLLFPNLVMNASLSYASIELGVTGPTALITEQDASGEAAIAWGAQLVAAGRAEVVLAGAADELDPIIVEVLRDTGAIDPSGPHPLDRRAAGCAPGEGATVLVLEPLSAARARGARVYATLVPHDGFSVPSPVHGWPADGTVLGRRLATVVGDADLIVAAADGAPVRDRLESVALAVAVGDRRPAITAPRGAIGAFGSAGALGVATAVLAVHHSRVPPTLGCESPRSSALDVVRDRARSAAVRVAVAHGLARGGVCRPVRVEAVAG